LLKRTSAAANGFDVMTDRGFEEGYREGWLSVAGTAQQPDRPTQPPPEEPRDYDNGFLYGRSDALERFRPHA
jgi:hypothetical protein